MTECATFVVTDVELNGLDPRRHSMISLACVAISAEQGVISEFSVNLSPRSDRTHDPVVAAWWRERPQALAAVTRDAIEPRRAMELFVAWTRSLPNPRAFAARPLMLDGAWVDIYLRDLCGLALFAPPWAKEALFCGAGMDIGSYLEGVYGWRHPDGLRDFAPEWMGGHAHTHAAIDDARGYAHVLLRALREPRGAREAGAFAAGR